MIDKSAARRGALALLGAFLVACASTGAAPTPGAAEAPAGPPALRPTVVTQRVALDSDDPAIWLHPTDRSLSLVLGTDKGDNGAVYVFDLAGRILKRFGGMRRPNNVDVEYGFRFGGASIDIAVATERNGDTVRVFRLPELEPIDGGPIPVFEGEAQRRPMGVGLYKRPRDGALFAILSRKTGPTGSYMWQYRIEDGGAGRVTLAKVRAFGAFGGGGEIEAIAVDDALGYLYYSDEWKGVRKYAADPDAADANRELAMFGIDGFKEDREGLSIYKVDDGTGYILVSDQQANQFRIFPREGAGGDPHAHPLLKVVRTSTLGSDGSEVTSAGLGPAFPDGLFVAMSEGGTFHYYAWPDVAGAELRVAQDGVRKAPTP
jgi:3-phytase